MIDNDTADFLAFICLAGAAIVILLILSIALYHKRREQKREQQSRRRACWISRKRQREVEELHRMMSL